jgi:hypothetical protein
MLAGQPPAGPRHKTPTSASAKVAMFAGSIFPGRVWPKLSVLLLGKEVRMSACNTGSVAKAWAHAGASDVFLRLPRGPLATTWTA